MRLLRVDTPDLELVEFQAAPPPYAILSHRWEAEEVLYKDLKTSIYEKAGLKKIRYALEQAREDGFQYLWVDTCCIDKADSSELSEAVNSMYRWYRNAGVCYAYLSDVETIGHDFESSRWFTRGWTLQELLAPQDVMFFSGEWELIGTKDELSYRLAVITGIDQAILQGTSPIASASIAQRMFWVAKRTTTRTEDIAYCMLGIFDVNMPLIYGEGEKAFMRLQEHIANESNDQTLFAWAGFDARSWIGEGLLAKSPRHFIDSGRCVACRDPESSEPYSISKKRLKIEVRLLRPPEVQLLRRSDILSWPYESDIYLAILSCVDTNDITRLIAIMLKRDTDGREEYRRVPCAKLLSAPCVGTLTTITVPQTPYDSSIDRIIRLPDYSITLCNVYKGFLTQVQLIKCRGNEGQLDGQVGNKVCQRDSVEETSKLFRRLALRGEPRRSIGQSSPNKIAVELVMHIGYLGRTYGWKPPLVRVLCGMTADLKLGFDAQMIRPIDYTRVHSLVPWDGVTSVNIPCFYGILNMEFIPKGTRQSGYTFDIKISGDLKLLLS